MPSAPTSCAGPAARGTAARIHGASSSADLSGIANARTPTAGRIAGQLGDARSHRWFQAWPRSGPSVPEGSRASRNASERDRPISFSCSSLSADRARRLRLFSAIDLQRDKYGLGQKRPGTDCLPGEAQLDPSRSRLSLLYSSSSRLVAEWICGALPIALTLRSGGNLENCHDDKLDAGPRRRLRSALRPPRGSDRARDRARRPSRAARSSRRSAISPSTLVSQLAPSAAPMRSPASAGWSPAKSAAAPMFASRGSPDLKQPSAVRAAQASSTEARMSFASTRRRRRAMASRRSCRR